MSSLPLRVPMQFKQVLVAPSKYLSEAHGVHVILSSLTVPMQS